MRLLFGLVVVLLLAGCATEREDGFNGFYRDVMPPAAVAQARGANPAPATYKATRRRTCRTASCAAVSTPTALTASQSLAGE
jgi:hypothetical protein